MISVCIATYNCEKYIKEQLDSILSQLSADDEIVISDDCSTDNTLMIIESICDSRIKIFHHKAADGPSHIKVTKNFENALLHAKGDFLFMADQDDIWTSDKIRISMEYLQNYDYVVSDCLVTDCNLNVINDTRFFTNSGITKSRWKALFKPTPYQGSCAAFKRCVLLKATPFPVGIQSHDRWIGYVASFFFSYKIIEEKLIYYRRHDNNVSTTLNGSKNSTINKVKTRFKYIIELIKLSFRHG